MLSKGSEPVVDCVILEPSAIGGKFVIELIKSHNGTDGTNDTNNKTTIWDRVIDNGFPDIKVLKTRIRDAVSPDVDIGHSDVNHFKSVC
jgi:predicted Rdx family selenoprotein